MTNFIQIKNIRLLKSTIKRYQPQDDLTLFIYFNASKSVRVDCEVFKFHTKEERDDVLTMLDAKL